MSDIGSWLELHGLGKYAELFADNEIDLDILPDVTEIHLKELGIALGGRLRVLRAIATLASPPSPHGIDTEIAGDEGAAPLHTSPIAQNAAAAERRQLTVMFCDLVGSTALSTQMDPEDLRDVITTYQDACRKTIARYEGFIARYMGDGILVYFGYPQAHENDPERAIRTALDILEAMPRMYADVREQHGVELAVRIGVATGPVVVGDMIGEGAAEEAAVVGETPNLAARLQGIAQPNQLVISRATERIVGDLFTFDDLGTQELKGIAEPVQAWRVTGAADIESRHEIRRQTGSSPLVGRQEELGLLLRAWEGAREGRGQVVLIQGEAGVGKSRLLEALREPLVDQDYTWVSIRCSPYHASSTLYPVIEHFKRVMNWEPEDTDRSRLEKLEVALQTQSLPLEEVVPLYAELMSLPLSDSRYPALTMTPKQKRDATLDAIVSWLLELAETKPMLQAFEDLHWADPTTLELLGLYIEQSPTVSMLNVLTYRPEFVPPWSMRSHMIPITLNRLERPEVEAFVSNLVAGKTLPREVLEHIVTMADGVPLYVEELTKTILESELLREEADQYELDGTLAELQIPSTLQDSLMARLDRVPTLREVAQVGSVLGREFPYEMIRHLMPLDEPMLQGGLDQLIAAEILYRRGRGQRATYRFKHALIQEAAYASLLRRTRQRYHGQVAALLEAEFADAVEHQPELLARHYSQSGAHPGKAVEYWRRAADLTLSRGANVEAVAQLNAALENLTELEASTERDQLELELQTKLGPAITNTRGYTNAQVRECYARARVLCETLGEQRRLALILRWQHTDELIRGDVAATRRIAAHLAEVVEGQGDVGLLLGGHLAVALTETFSGRFQEALERAEDGAMLFNPAERRVEDWAGGQPGEQCRLMAALIRWLIGEPDAALEYLEATLEILRHSDQRYTHVLVLSIGALVPLWRNDSPLVKEWASASDAICRDEAIEFWRAFNECLLAWVEAKESPSTAALDRIEDALGRFEAQGVRLLVPVLLSLLAERCLDIGDARRGLAAAERGLNLISQNNELWIEAELHRLSGELLLVSTPQRLQSAEESISRAIELSRSQGARSLELRALRSLVRMRAGRAGEVEARTQLTACYAQFTEGLDTADLRDAKAVLGGDRTAVG